MLTGMSTGQDQWCVVKVVANAAAGCAVELRMYRTRVVRPRKLCVGFSISHFARVCNNIINKEGMTGGDCKWMFGVMVTIGPVACHATDITSEKGGGSSGPLGVYGLRTISHLSTCAKVALSSCARRLMHMRECQTSVLDICLFDRLAGYSLGCAFLLV